MRQSLRNARRYRCGLSRASGPPATGHDGLNEVNGPLQAMDGKYRRWPESPEKHGPAILQHQIRNASVAQTSNQPLGQPKRYLVGNQRWRQPNILASMCCLYLAYYVLDLSSEMGPVARLRCGRAGRLGWGFGILQCRWLCSSAKTCHLGPQRSEP